MNFRLLFRCRTALLCVTLLALAPCAESASAGAPVSAESYCSRGVRGVFTIDKSTVVAVGAADVVAEDELSLRECEEEAELDAKALLTKKGFKGTGMVKVCAVRKADRIYAGVSVISHAVTFGNSNYSNPINKEIKK